MLNMNINSTIDAGNIKVVDINQNTNQATLSIVADSNSEFKQWFYFKFNGQIGENYVFEISNASECSYAQGWENYQVVASYDGDYWFRIDTEYTEQKTLKFSHTLDFSSVQFAYFTPYSYSRHMELISQSQMSELCQHHVIGQTVDKRDIDLLRISQSAITNDANKKNIWIIARQHPGETMAQWCAEGLIDRLLDEDDPLSKSLLSKANFYLVPNMNVDGSVRGNLRSNAAGANLNREWQNPSLEKSPEVFHVRQKMREVGVDIFLDLHGDEALPYVFVAAGEGNPSYNDRIKQLEESFSDCLKAINPDFQTKFGYPKDEPGKANLTVASNWVGEEFDCLSLTLEMPFKDNANLPNIETGWSAQRSIILGETLLNPLYQIINSEEL